MIQFLYMRKTILTILLFLLLSPVSFLHAQKTKLLPQKIQLPNGWGLSPAGTSLPLGDLPLNIAISPSKNFLAVTNNGQSTQSIQLIDVKNEKVVSDIVIPKS